MLQKTYSIYSDDLNDAQLFVEAGKNHIACWCKKSDDTTIRAFEFFQCDDYTPENFETLVDNTRLYSRLLTMPVKQNIFFWNTNEVLCLPPGNDSDDFLKNNFDMMLGNKPEATISSAPTKYCLVAWRIETRQQNIAQQCFQGATFTHQYVPLLNSLQSTDKNIYLFFYPYYFTLILLKEGKLQFAQTRKYSTPEDVLYFVLNVCEQYDIEKNVNTFCGGFIEERSQLYETLYQYLEGLQLIQPDESLFASAEFKEYAPHYFAPYVNYIV